MIKDTFKFTPLLPFLMLCGTAAASDVSVLSNSVAQGTDYFVTGPGTLINFNGAFGFGTINFQGVPVGPGPTDTIIQRLGDAVIGGASIPIQMTALSLESTGPVSNGTGLYNVFLTLDPGNLANDTGSASISGNTTGGTFISSLNVFFELSFAPLGASPAMGPVFSHTFLHGGGTWQPTPPPGAMIVPGVDDGGPTDQPANLHSRLQPCSRTANGLPCEVDFFVNGNMVNRDDSGAVADVARSAPTPEPATLGLAGLALLGVVVSAKRRR